MARARVLIRPDAGASSGLGHVQRCLALAAALAERGVECAFLLPAHVPVQERVELAGFSVRPLEQEQPDAPAEAIAATVPGTVLVVDSYRVGGAYLQELRKAGLLVVALDDEAAYALPCQLCVNGGAAAKSASYRSSTGDTRFLLGLDYAMVRPELWDATASPSADAVREVLVTLGGGDPHGLLPSLLAALDALPAGFALTVAVGPYVAERAALAAAARTCAREVTLLDAPTTLVPAMESAHLAVSAGGQTLYELVRLGVPTIAIEVAENQRAGLEALAAAGAVEAAGRAGNGIASTTAGTVGSLLADAWRRRSLSRRAGALIDGQGARRVAAAICEL
jgi:UDP-2,4-diacetamido-2,4,6-trideoxy-beta-L-altropyranose hydrolase